MNICIYGASSDNISAEYITACEMLGREIAKRGHAIVFGGGARGLMGAAARGADNEGGTITGVAPRFFDKEGILYPRCTEFIFTDTMRERKQIMENRSDAFIVMPGGIGTFEEFFEILTLKQLGRHSKAICVFNINGYYDAADDIFRHSVSEGFMSDSFFSLYSIFENPADIIDYLEKYDPDAHQIELSKLR